ncbi:MAG: flagellar assembly peptidoglycan hydrolase FlgJ, partial [Gammaproteobacteria bacterium]
MDISFNDLGSLQSITALGKRDRGEALGEVARQFESFFVSQMLKGMRAANSMMSADDPFQTQEMQFRQQMLDDQLGISLTQGKGLGLAAMIEQAMRRQFRVGDDPPGASNRPEGADDTADIEARRISRAPLQSPRAPAPYAMPDPASTQPGPTLPASAAVASAAPELPLPTVLREAVEAIGPAVDAVRERVAALRERFSDKKSFVEALAPHAREAAARLGVDHRLLIAQAALETGWGQSILGDSAGRSSMNLFNIKAGSYWQGPSVGVTTLEFRDGVPRPERARFRAYGSFAESFGDYANLLLGNGRYRDAVDNAAN